MILQKIIGNIINRKITNIFTVYCILFWSA